MRVVTTASTFSHHLSDMHEHGAATVAGIAELIGMSLVRVGVTSEPDEHGDVDILADGWYDASG
ncbi:MAG: hypothetical protein ACK4RS_00005, partial [Thiothrix sp.]